MNIGILLPLSNAYPTMSRDFLDGFNSYLAQKYKQESITFIKENIGFGGSEKDVYSKAEKLLITDDVDILIAYADEKVVPIIYPLLQATGKLMMLVNPGANYPVNWIAQPTVIRLNLQHAFLCWLTGAKAAHTYNGNGALASTVYDCGYLHSAVMVKQFMDNGGNIMHNYINNQAYKDNFEISQLINFLQANPSCKNLLCVFDELPARLFYKSLKAFKADAPLHIFASPMMVEQKALADLESGFLFSIESHITWQPDLNTEDNKHFIESCKRPANIFSLLGWEAAIVVCEILSQKNIEFEDGENIVALLKNTALNSPRGRLRLDYETQTYLSPIGRFTLKAGTTMPEIEWIDDMENHWRKFTSEPTEGAVTGWTNTYLCY